MNLNEYGQVIKRTIYIPIILAVVLGGYAYSRSQQSSTVYSGAVTFTAGNSGIENGSNGSSGNLTATSNLADTLLSWLNSPNFMADVYKKSGTDVPQIAPTDLASKITATKTLPNSAVIVAQITAGSHKETEELLVAMQGVVNDRMEAYHANNSIPSQLSINATTPIVTDQTSSPQLNIFVAMLAGLVLGVVISLFVEAIRQSR